MCEGGGRKGEKLHTTQAQKKAVQLDLKDIKRRSVLRLHVATLTCSQAMPWAQRCKFVAARVGDTAAGRLQDV